MWAVANDDQAALRKEAKISMQQAEKTALVMEPGTIKSKELERENGKLIYSFDIRTKSGIREVNVDAISGNVLEDWVETKAAEAKEKQQDAKRHRSKKAQTPPSSPQ
jgi:uncharacterized membrane protein YkoI